MQSERECYVIQLGKRKLKYVGGFSKFTIVNDVAYATKHNTLESAQYECDALKSVSKFMTLNPRVVKVKIITEVLEE